MADAIISTVVTTERSRGRPTGQATTERQNAGHKHDWVPFGQNTEHTADLEACRADGRSRSQTGSLLCSLKNVRAVLWCEPQELIEDGSGNLEVPTCWTANHHPVIGGRS